MHYVANVSVSPSDMCPNDESGKADFSEAKPEELKDSENKEGMNEVEMTDIEENGQRRREALAPTYEEENHSITPEDIEIGMSM